MWTVEVGKLRGCGQLSQIQLLQELIPQHPRMHATTSCATHRICQMSQAESGLQREVFRWILFLLQPKPQPGNHVQIKINNTMNLDSLFHEVQITDNFRLVFPLLANGLLSTWLKVDEFLISEWIHKIMHQGLHKSFHARKRLIHELAFKTGDSSSRPVFMGQLQSAAIYVI